MDSAFERVVSRTILGNDLRFTATSELVASEFGIDTVTVADIRRWLDENDERATRAALNRRLSVGGHALGSDKIIRLTVKDMSDAAIGS